MGDARLFPDTGGGADLPDAAALPERQAGGDAVIATAPLAARMRPRDLDDLVGQDAALGPGTPLRSLLDRGELTSLILWGPPGVGKTSLASVIAARVDAAFLELSAVTAGVKDVRRIVEEGRSRVELHGRRTVLFLDEIHRFNKAQQDALLPGVEAGWIVLVGATTENPFFELNAPLLSRCQLVRLEPLDDDAVRSVVLRAIADPVRGYAGRVHVEDEALDHLVRIGDGDARAALSALELAVAAVGTNESGEDGPEVTLTVADVSRALQRLRYDKSADAHYDQVSAFIKSLRGSDPDAAVYWLLRMLEAGEDPRFLARRMVILASEDVGLADRQALPLAVAAFEALEIVGLPEARYALVHAAVSLACAPKSNSIARALAAGLETVKRHGNLPVPAHLRDAHYRGARHLGHGVGYEYPHDDPGYPPGPTNPGGFAPAQSYLPEELEGTRLFEAGRHGHEAVVADRIAELRARARRARVRGAGTQDLEEGEPR